MKTVFAAGGAFAALALGCGGCAGSSGGHATGADGGKDSGRVVGGNDGGGPGNDAMPGSDATMPQDATTDTASAGDTGSGMPSVGGIFMQPEPWTTDVSGTAVDPTSAAIIAAMDALGGWGNGNVLQIDFSIPLFFATAATPQQTITAQAGGYCYGGPDCDPVPFQMPVPANANIEGSTNLVCDTANNDCHLLVVDTSQNKLFELYNSTQAGSGLSALGGFIWDLTKAYPPNERGDQCTSADAAGFPIAGLLPTADEVAAGTVKHALRFILPNAKMKKGVYIHPASHAGGPSSTNANSPPYGVRLRLKSTFDSSTFNTGEKVILKAMQTYGMLLSDGGNIALTFADDRTTTAKWATVGVTAQSFNAIGVDNFEVVLRGPDIALTDNCVRNP